MKLNYCLFTLLLLWPLLGLTDDSISYSLHFSNLSDVGNMSLTLATKEGVETIDGIDTRNPVSLPSGHSQEVKFLIKHHTTSWQLKFAICRDSSATSGAKKCLREAESICQFDASGVGDLPFYMSNSQNSRFKCNPESVANQQHVTFSVSND